MARYRNTQGLEDLEKSIEQYIAAEQPAEPEIEAVSAEDETFKKRYGDLRRYTQYLLQQKTKTLRMLCNNYLKCIRILRK